MAVAIRGTPRSARQGRRDPAGAVGAKRRCGRERHEGLVCMPFRGQRRVSRDDSTRLTLAQSETTSLGAGRLGFRIPIPFDLSLRARSVRKAGCYFFGSCPLRERLDMAFTAPEGHAGGSGSFALKHGIDPFPLTHRLYSRRGNHDGVRGIMRLRQICGRQADHAVNTILPNGRCSIRWRSASLASLRG